MPKVFDTLQPPKETFLSHLVELRRRIMKAGIGFLVVFLCFMPWVASIYDFLAMPMLSSLPEGSKMIATGVITPFLVPVKVTMLLAGVITLPWMLYQAWAFIAPGLYINEKKLIAPLVVFSSLLFMIGMAFCYFFVFRVVFHFVNQFAPHSIAVAPDIESYFEFVMTMFIAFGMTFEVPVIVIILVRIGIVSIEKLRSLRPYIIVCAFIIAAIVTPPDVFSQLLLAIPLCLLFELGLWVAPWFEKTTQVDEYSE